MSQQYLVWYQTTLQGTNISPRNGILKMIFLFPMWDMLIPWRVYIYIFGFHFTVKERTIPLSQVSCKRGDFQWQLTGLGEQEKARGYTTIHRVLEHWLVGDRIMFFCQAFKSRTTKQNKSLKMNERLLRRHCFENTIVSSPGQIS